jgi:hypothetical protein
MVEHEPTDKSKWFKRVAVFSAIFFCTYQFGFSPLYEKYQDQWYTQDESGERVKKDILVPGFYFKFGWPFIKHIPDEYVGVFHHKKIYLIPATEIPIGYVGVLTHRGTKMVQPKSLPPGKYYINRQLYDVTEVYTGKQTWQFGGEAIKDD